MEIAKDKKLSNSHASENSFSVKPQPVSPEMKKSMEESAENATKMIYYYDSINRASIVNCENYPTLTKKMSK